MAEKTENAKKQQSDLLDTKYGTVDPASLELGTSKAGKAMATATMVTVGGKSVKIYAHGEARIGELKAKIESGEPFIATGALLGQGSGISANKFEATTYSGKVLEVSKTGENELGPWALIKMQVNGKDKPFGIMVTDDEVERVVGAGDAEISLDVVWRATQFESGRWGSTAVTANSLRRSPAEPKVEEAPAPEM